MRVVFDTNVYIAAVNGTYTYEWLTAAGQGKLELFCSEAIFAELAAKLQEQQVQCVDEYIDRIRESIKIVRPTERLRVVKADPDDDRILECAVEARASLIITMDKHLLRLKRFRSVGIAHPSDLKYIFRAEHGDEPRDDPVKNDY